MKIKMKSTAAGPLGNFASGHIYEVDDTIAERFIAGGYAEPVPAPPAEPAAATSPEEIAQAAPESAALATPEAAMLPSAQPRRRGRRDPEPE